MPNALDPQQPYQGRLIGVDEPRQLKQESCAAHNHTADVYNQPHSCQHNQHTSKDPQKEEVDEATVGQ